MTGRRSDDVGASPLLSSRRAAGGGGFGTAGGGWAVTGVAWGIACGDAHGTRGWEPRARWLRDLKDHHPLRDGKGALVEISLRINEL